MLRDKFFPSIETLRLKSHVTKEYRVTQSDMLKRDNDRDSY